MPRCLARTDDRVTTEAQHLVCSHLVRACQQAIYDLALDDEREPEVRRRAIEALREVFTDWREARKAVRAGMGSRGTTFTVR
jgi:hypothetical protein